ncbi:hypothetical protein ACRAWC_03680 [Leifsonia sp. L25]|uniref:hypothetical protein n=1 Tax=Actinomycetes TaxID=1760 RepID=UPI003D68352B
MQDTEQQHAATVLEDPPAQPASRVLPIGLFWAAVSFWASGTLVFWTFVYFGTESLRQLLSDPTYKDPYAPLEAIAAPIFSAWAWLPLLFIAVCLALSSRAWEGPYPRLALAIVRLVWVPILIGFVAVFGFLAFVLVAGFF